MREIGFGDAPVPDTKIRFDQRRGSFSVMISPNTPHRPPRSIRSIFEYVKYDVFNSSVVTPTTVARYG
jgi:hypothetical protein